MKYIDADRLKAEIEKHIKEVKDVAGRFTPNLGFFDAKLSGIYDVMAIIDSLQQKQLLSYADESNPAIEAMADLERTYFCNPDKLPKWLKDDIARKELNAHTKGYNKGYKDAEKRYNESVAYPFPILCQHLLLDGDAMVHIALIPTTIVLIVQPSIHLAEQSQHLAHQH